MARSNADQVHLKGLSGGFSGKEYTIKKGEFIVGRLPECDMVIAEDTISGRHAKLFKGEEFYEVQDLGSTNGTFVNNDRIERKMLRTGDKIKFDIFEFEFINPKDVPRTVLADYGADGIPEETIISPAPGEQQTVRLPAQEQTIKLPAREKAGQFPSEEPTELIREKQAEQHKPPEKEKKPAAYKKSGNLFTGFISGLLLALAVGYIASFFVVWSSSNYSMGNIWQLFAVVAGVYPQLHLPTHWLDTQLSFSTIIILGGIILGLIAGGLVTRHISRKSRLTGSFFFALFYMIIVMAAQLALFQFSFDTFLRAYPTVGIGSQDPLINIAFTMGSIFIAGFIFSFIGSLFSRK
jgi:pSer/pThr/pTyr-binding forkhead associated (FHA) protein